MFTSTDGSLLRIFADVAELATVEGYTASGLSGSVHLRS